MGWARRHTWCVITIQAAVGFGHGFAIVSTAEKIPETAALESIPTALYFCGLLCSAMCVSQLE